MSISGISDTTYTPAVDDTQAAIAAQATASVTTQADSTDAAGGVGRSEGQSAHVSHRGHFLAKLESLSKSDPEKFKALTASIADTLETAAGQATGPEAERLTEMAKRFKSASETGTTDELQPRPPQGTAAMRYSQADGSDDATRPAAPVHHDGPSAGAKAVWSQIFSEVEQA